MRGQATVDPQRRFLRFEFDEGANLDDWREAQALFMRLSQETGIRRVLVDLRKQKVSGPQGELFNFGANLPAGMAFAVLADLQRDDYRFVETVALNRGKAVSLFSSLEEDAAIRWLEAGGAPVKRKG